MSKRIQIVNVHGPIVDILDDDAIVLCLDDRRK